MICCCNIDVRAKVNGITPSVNLGRLMRFVMTTTYLFLVNFMLYFANSVSICGRINVVALGGLVLRTSSPAKKSPETVKGSRLQFLRNE